VLTAANLGGTSDVVTAAAGALAGAHYGASAIPTLWRNSLMKLQLLESFADRLLAHALLEFGN
jgi:ADP-ribosyl-[dinitrogen reductase] hydrolase